VGLHRCALPDGRILAVDDVGDPAGRAVVYLHGTPDARQARHPDDGLAAAAGVRLLAVDRAGFGDSDPDPTGGLTAIGADLGALLDDLGVGRAALVGWSAGGLAALAAASVLGDRIERVVLVATLPPVEAYRDPDVVAALGASRRPFVEMALELPPADLAAEVAPYLLPDPLTEAAAREHVLDGAGPVGAAELAAVPGAVEALVAGLLAAGRHGTTGVEHDLRLQLEPGLDLGAIRVPVLAVHGSEDGVAPPEVGRWLVEQLPDGVLETVPGAGHHLWFTRWPELVRSFGEDPAG
jgi:pimeloyl-ACP methyl ester carboxylesterase